MNNSNFGIFLLLAIVPVAFCVRGIINTDLQTDGWLPVIGYVIALIVMIFFLFKISKNFNKELDDKKGNKE